MSLIPVILHCRCHVIIIHELIQEMCFDLLVGRNVPMGLILFTLMPFVMYSSFNCVIHVGEMMAYCHTLFLHWAQEVQQVVL